jgi:PD-(D/E)XK nuclease superfamily protein
MSVPDWDKTELDIVEILAARISDLDLLKPTPSEFNVFEAMGVVFQEARHSDFRAFLLNPQANHGLGDRFTKGWLSRVVGSVHSDISGNEDADTLAVISDLLERLDSIDMSGAQVHRERYRIDVLLVDQTNRLTTQRRGSASPRIICTDQ